MDVGPWSVCSSTCGSGIQTCKVDCQRRLAENVSIPVSVSQCDLLAKPATNQECEVRPCAEWKKSNQECEVRPCAEWKTSNQECAVLPCAEWKTNNWTKVRENFVFLA